MDTRTKMYFEELQEGMAIPSATYGPMDRYKHIPIAIILRDTNPLHLDRVYAQERGMPDVVQQGPLNETFLYRFLTDWLHRPWDLRKTKIRFAANVFPDDLLTCGGTVTRKYYENGEPRVDCQIWQQNQKSERILVGEATFTLPNGITQRGRGKRRGDEMGKDRKEKLPWRLIATPKYQVIMSTARQSLFRQIFMSLSSLLAISPFYPFSFFGKR